MSSIRTYFTLVIAATVAVSVIALALVVGMVGTWMVQQTHDLALQREANRVASLLSAQADWVGSGVCIFDSNPACTSVIDMDTPLGRTPEGLHVTDEQRKLARNVSRKHPLWSHDQIGSTRVRVLTAPLGDGTALIVASTTANVERSTERLNLLLLLAGAGVVLGAAVVSAIVAGRLARPVRELTHTAERLMTASDPSARMSTNRRDEIGRLAHAIDGMLARLQSAEDARRNLIADASHDLRSPLTAISSNLELLERPDVAAALRTQLLDDVRDETHDMARLVQSITDLARAESQPLRLTEVLHGELLHDALAVARRRWRSTQFVISIEPPHLAPSFGDAELLVRAMINVLDNAAKYGAADGRVEITSESDTTAWWVVVTDSGSGIPQTDIPHVFERFYRGEKELRTTGSGVGLAMVYQTAQRHGGRVDIASTPEAGTTVRFHVPHHPPPCGDAAR